MTAALDRSTSKRTQTVGLVTIALASFLLPMTLAGTSVALPKMGISLHASLLSLQWVINGYDLTFAAFMLAAGSVADSSGRRRLFRLGLAVYSVGLLVSGLATNTLVLDLARGLAGLGAAAVLTAGLACLANLFAEEAARAKAFGVFGTSVGVGLAFGPFICGVLNSTLSWRAVMFVPAAIAALLLVGTAWIPESKNAEAGQVDIPGTVLFSGALFLLIFGLLEGPQAGWASAVVLTCLVTAVIALAGFVTVERKVPHPMFELSLLRHRRFASLSLAVIALVFVFTPLLVYLPAYYSAVFGYSSQHVGLILMMLTVPALVFPTIAGYVSKWISIRALVLSTVILTAGGVAWLTVLSDKASAWTVFGPYLLIGIGVGISFGVMDNAAVGSVESGRAGMAAGMFNTMRVGGEVVGIAVVGTTLTAVSGHYLGSRIAGFSTPYAHRPGSAADLLNQGNLSTITSSLHQSAERLSFVHALTGSFTDAFHVVCWALAIFCALASATLVILDRPEPASAKPRSVEAESDLAESAPVTEPVGS